MIEPAQRDASGLAPAAPSPSDAPAPLSRWGAVEVRAGSEIAAAMALGWHGFEAWVPVKRERRREGPSRIRRDVDAPVWAGYVLVRFADAEAGRLRRARFDDAGLIVRRVVENGGGGFSRIPEKEISTLRGLVEDGEFDLVARLSPGKKVSVTDGKLCGQEVEIKRVLDHHRLLVLAQFFGKLCEFEVEALDVSAE